MYVSKHTFRYAICGLIFLFIEHIGVVVHDHPGDSTALVVYVFDTRAIQITHSTHSLSFQMYIFACISHQKILLMHTKLYHDVYQLSTAMESCRANTRRGQNCQRKAYHTLDTKRFCGQHYRKAKEAAAAAARAQTAADEAEAMLTDAERHTRDIAILHKRIEELEDELLESRCCCRYR